MPHPMSGSNLRSRDELSVALMRRVLLFSGLLVICVIVLLVTSPQTAATQSSTTSKAVQFTSPFVAAGGEHILVCAANLSPASPAPTVTAATSSTSAGSNPTVILEILNGVTGALLSQKQIALPPVGTPEPPDPCLEYAVTPPTVTSTTFSSITNLFIGRLEYPPEPTFAAPLPGIIATSLTIFTPDSNGNPTNVRVISFYPPDPCFAPPDPALVAPACRASAPPN